MEDWAGNGAYAMTGICAVGSTFGQTIIGVLKMPYEGTSLTRGSWIV